MGVSADFCISSPHLCSPGNQNKLFKMHRSCHSPAKSTTPPPRPLQEFLSSCLCNPSRIGSGVPDASAQQSFRPFNLPSSFGTAGLGTGSSGERGRLSLLLGVPPSVFSSQLKCHSFVLRVQSCPTLCDSMDGSPPGSSVHGIFQARRLEWVAIPLSRGSS